MPDALPNGSKHLPHDCTTRLNDLLRGVVSAEILALIFEIVDEVADRAHQAGFKHALDLIGAQRYGEENSLY